MTTLALPSVSAETQQTLTVLGRALFVATSFETDCRMLALCLKLRDPFGDIGKSDEFERFIREPAVAKLATNVSTIVAGMGLSKNYSDLLKDAREARNFIAHEAAEDLDQVFPVEEARIKWGASIDLKVREVALGKLVVAMMLSKVSAIKAPDQVLLRTYLDQVSQWVLAFDSDA